MTTPSQESPAGTAVDPATDPAAQVTEAIELPDIPPLTFDVPESFHALPLAVTPEERALLAEKFVRELYPNGDDDLWTPAAPYYAALGEALGERGLAYSAMGLFSIPEGIAHCSFTVAATESGHPSVEVAAHGIREILTRDESNDARWIDLPCGPAVSCVTLREITISPELTATGQEAKLQLGQVQVYVPFPTGPYTAIFTMDTAAVNYWGEFSEMTMAILRTITFAERESEREPDGGRTVPAVG